MKTLIIKNFQTQFTNEILDSKEKSEGFPLEIKPAGNLTVGQAFEVYRNGYYARLVEGMEETFKGVSAFLGNDVFFEACEEYIKNNPSPFYSLSDYGAHFPSFLQKAGDTNLFSFLSELARFEWEFKDLFHRKQHRAVDAAKITTLSEELDFKIRLGDAVSLFCSEFNVYKVWKLREEPEVMRQCDLEKAPQNLVLYKNGGQIFTKEVDLEEYRLLVSFSKTERLVSETLSESKMEPEHISSFFKFMFSSGIIEEIIY